MIGRLLLGFVLLWAVAAAASSAAAHAVLVESVPADGTVLAEAPATVRLRFNEPVSPVAVQVLDPAGAAVAGPADVTVDGGEVRIALPAGLAGGTYLVSYRVRSLDAHPVAGTLVFAVGAAAAPTAAAPDAGPDEAWLAAYAVNRVFFYASLTVACGGVFFLVLVLGGAPPASSSVRSMVRRAAAAGIATAALGVGLKGATLLSPSPAGLFAVSTWRAGAETTLGPSVALTVPALLLAALLVGGAPRAWRPAAALGAAVATVAGLALTGHAATAAPRWLTAPTLTLHGLAAAFWVGSLCGLSIVLRLGDAAAAGAAVARFSRRAVPAVLLLLLAGLVLAMVQVAALPALAATAYGRTLLVKIALVSLLLAVALYNNRRLAPRLAAGDARAGAALGRTVRIELALVLAIFGATAVLGSVPPSRTLPAADGATVTVESHANVAAVAVQPGTVGINELVVRLAGPDGQPLAPQSVSLALENEGAGIAPLRRDAEPIEAGTYVVRGVPLAVAGRWTVRIDALISDFEKLIFAAEIEIR